MGMALNDFLRLTPKEFSLICERWNEKEDARERSEWERTRMTCLCLLQPHSKKQLKAEDVMSFAWDSKPDRTTGEEVSREDKLRRFEEVKKARGLV
jgi:hypothetical protein